MRTALKTRRANLKKRVKSKKKRKQWYKQNWPYILILSALSFLSCEHEPDATLLKVVNGSDQDTITVYLTLGVKDGYVDDVNGIFGISSTKKTQGSFILYPNDTVSYTSSKPFQANISFNAAPLNCPYPAPTLYEVVLNNCGTATNAQETVDISCVAGVSTIGSISMTGGGNWTDNVKSDSITKIQNQDVYHNTGLSGVFPYGCTNCVNTGGAPECDNSPDYATPNSEHLCTVQRNAKNSGGIVTITYLSTVK